MLVKFKVTGYKGFKDPLILDLKARDYVFNKNIVKNNIVNKGLIYGKNGIGKSNLGTALFDIILHLTDKEKLPDQYLQNYLNLESEKNYAEFTYHFLLDSYKVIYEYKKSSPYYLIEEKLTINDKLVIYYNYFNKENNYVDADLIGTLNIELIDNKLSIIKYIYRNLPTDPASPLYKMMTFVENMLWYRGLSEGNAYCGFKNGGEVLTDGLYEHSKTKDFQDFLAANEIYYDLGWRNINGIHELIVKFPFGNVAPFMSIASTGTKSLLLFYYWSISFNEISFLFIDEFDAFFHYESAANIVTILNKNTSFQTLITTHNTYLMQNKFTRPDCCFLMTKNCIKNLYNSTDKEIREAHNLEKMYINGVFTDNDKESATNC